MKKPESKIIQGQLDLALTNNKEYRFFLTGKATKEEKHTEIGTFTSWDFEILDVAIECRDQEHAERQIREINNGVIECFCIQDEYESEWFQEWSVKELVDIAEECLKQEEPIDDKEGYLIDEAHDRYNDSL